MPEFTAKDVQRLRQLTGAGMLDSKKVLEEADGDFDAAVKLLRERGVAQTGKRADREASEGVVAASSTGSAAALVELVCETDFVAKSPDFVNLVSEMAEAVAARGESAADDFAKALEDLRITLKENIQLGRVVRYEATEGAVLDTYLHVQSDRGVNGVIVELVGGGQQEAHEVALHVASMRPQWLSREDVPADVVEAERGVMEAKTRNEGKPEQAIPKIVEGRMNGFFKENCLLDQAWVKDNKQTISGMLGSARITRFAQVEIGN